MTPVVTVLAVAAAGAIGALVRHEATRRTPVAGSARRAVAVATVNLGGSVVLAALLALDPPELVLAAVGVGFCGALTTFSTWVVDAARAGESDRSLRVVVALDLGAQLATGVLIVLGVSRLLGSS